MTVPPTRPATLVLTDPQALRVLAHRSRQQLLNALERHDTLTATQAAAIAGITPSAMSYHLRALQKWGIVEPVESADGRERPWRLTADTLEVKVEPSDGGDPVAERALLASLMRQQLDQLISDWSATDRSDQRKGQVSMMNAWLTQDELLALTAAVEQALEPYQKRTARNMPAGATAYSIAWLSIPEPDQS